MPTHCCVPGCYEKGGHSFPKNETLRKQWIIAIKRDVGRYFQITRTTVVCHKHFTPADYNNVTFYGELINLLISEISFRPLDVIIIICCNKLHAYLCNIHSTCE